MNLSPDKIFLVGLIAVIVLGPERLPQAARTAGRMLAELRRLSSSVQNEVVNAISEPRHAIDEAVGEFGLGDVRTTLMGARNSVRGAINEVVNGVTGQGPTPGAATPRPSALDGAHAVPFDPGLPAPELPARGASCPGTAAGTGAACAGAVHVNGRWFGVAVDGRARRPVAQLITLP